MNAEHTHKPVINMQECLNKNAGQIAVLRERVLLGYEPVIVFCILWLALITRYYILIDQLSLWVPCTSKCFSTKGAKNIITAWGHCLTTVLILSLSKLNTNLLIGCLNKLQFTYSAFFVVNY